MPDETTESANLPELTCKELVELVTDYLEGALSAETRKRFDDHLEGCPFCRIYLEQMRQTIGALGQLSDEAISSGMLDVLREHLRRGR